MVYMNPPGPRSNDTPSGGPSKEIPPGKASLIAPSSKPRTSVQSSSKSSSGTPNAEKRNTDKNPDRPGSNKSTTSRSDWGTPADTPSPEKDVGKLHSKTPLNPTQAYAPLPQRHSNIHSSPAVPHPQSGKPRDDSAVQHRQHSHQGKPQKQVSWDQLLPNSNPQPVIPAGQRATPVAAQAKTGQSLKGIRPPPSTHSVPTRKPCTQSNPGPRKKIRRSTVKRKIYEDPNARPWKLFKWTMSTHKLKKISILLIIAGVALIALGIGGTFGITQLHART